MAKSIAAERAPAGLSARELAPYLVWTLLVAGLGEMFLFRLLSRVGVHIPKQGNVLEVYEALVRAGNFAFNVASVVVFGVVGLLAYLAIKRWSNRSSLVASAPALVMAFAGLSFLLAFLQEDAAIKFVYGLFSVGVMLLLLAAGLSDRSAGGWRKAAMTAIVVAYLGSQYHTLSNQGYQALGIAATPPATRALLEIAELVIVANAFLVFAGWSGVSLRLRSWRPFGLPLLFAGALMLGFVGAYRGEDSSTAAILSLWTIGLTLYLPLPAYVLALGVYGAATVACLRSHDPVRRWDGVAFALLPVAGLTLEMGYQHLVAIVVLLILTRNIVGNEEIQPALSRRKWAEEGEPALAG